MTNATETSTPTYEINVPRVGRYYRNQGDDGGRNAKASFELSLRAFLVSALPKDWDTLLEFTWTNETFRIDGKGYRAEKFKGARQGNMLKLDEPAVNALRTYVNNRIAQQQRALETQSRRERAVAILNPVADRHRTAGSWGTVITLNERFGVCIEFGEYAVRSQLTITAEGEILEPAATYGNAGKTIASAQEFIQKFTPTFDILKLLAARIKHELPDGFFQ